MATKSNEKSILLISRTPSVLENVGRAASAIPNSALKAHESSIFEMNGHAAELAATSDIVIFEADTIDEGELAVIRAMTSARGENRTFVALTDSSLPIAKARLLTGAGVDEIVPMPCTDEDLAQLFSRPVAGRVAAEPRQAGNAQRKGRVIAVSRARGGIGATTVAVNLAYLLQERRGLLRKQATNRVAIVDLELQFGNVGIFLDVEDRGAMLEIAKSSRAPDREFLRTAVNRRKCGLGVLPAPGQPVPLDALDPAKVEGLLDALQSEYDYVVVDMPHALVPWIAPVIARAEKILIATDTTVPGVRHARRLIDFYTEDIPVLPIEIVVMHEKRPMFMSGHQKEAASVLERPLTHWLPDDGHRAVDAMDRGEPVVELHGGSELSKALRRMAKTVAKSLSVTATTTATTN